MIGNNSGKIVLSGVNKYYYVDGVRMTVFDDLDLVIDPNEITVLIGKSGSGKTTLLRLLAGLEEPDSGEIVFPDDIRLGMMFQEPRLMPWLTCEKNVTLGMKDPSKKASDEILAMVGLSGFEKAYPSQLSGGMKQRAALARTLIRDSNLILMDEPFAALDSRTRKDLQQELLRIRRETGAGIIFVTHDLNEAVTIGDRIISINGNAAEEVEKEEL